MKKVSIIVPIYNMGHSLKNCIESLLKQTYPKIEIILIDDGSTDNTFEICEEYNKISSKVKSWHTENRGSGPARNYGIEKASGDFVYFMDADDILDENALSVIIQEIMKQESDLVVFGYKKAESSGKIITVKNYDTESFDGDYIRKNYDLFFDMNFKRGIQGPPWNKFFNLKLIQKRNIRYPAMKRHQDEVFISRYMSHVNKVSFIKDVLYTHFINDIKSKQVKFPLNYIEIVKELYRNRLETVAEWNEDNKRISALIYIEYIYNSIKAFDIIFSKKAKMTKKERESWLKREISTIPVNKELVELSEYQNKIKISQIRIFLNLIEEKKYRELYIMLKIRVFLETKFKRIILLMKKNMVTKLGKIN